VNSEVKSLAFLSKNYNGFFIERNWRAEPELPKHHKATSSPCCRWPSFQSAALISRWELRRFTVIRPARRRAFPGASPAFRPTPLVGRFDVPRTFHCRYFFAVWTFRPELSLHDTYYTERKSAIVTANVPLDEPLIDAPWKQCLRFVRPLSAASSTALSSDRTVKAHHEPYVTYRIRQRRSGFQNVIRFESATFLATPTSWIRHQQPPIPEEAHHKPICDLHPNKPCETSVTSSLPGTGEKILL